MQELSGQAAELDIKLLDKKVDQMMPELGFTSDDNDRLVASYSGGWQMRMCLGKILLQEPDLLLLDEPTNHLDLDALEWLEGVFGLRKTWCQVFGECLEITTFETWCSSCCWMSSP